MVEAAGTESRKGESIRSKSCCSRQALRCAGGTRWCLVRRRTSSSTSTDDRTSGGGGGGSGTREVGRGEKRRWSRAAWGGGAGLLARRDPHRRIQRAREQDAFPGNETRVVVPVPSSIINVRIKMAWMTTIRAWRLRLVDDGRRTPSPTPPPATCHDGEFRREEVPIQCGGDCGSWTAGGLRGNIETPDAPPATCHDGEFRREEVPRRQRKTHQRFV